MKKVIQPVCIIFAAMLMAWSCNKDDSPAPLLEDEAVAVQFSSNIGGIASLAKAAAIKPAAAGSAWANNDAIGAFMVNHGSSTVRNGATNKKYVTASGNGNFTPDGAANTVYYPINGDKVDFIAYYPYVSSITSLGTYNVNVATQTTPAAIDLLYAKATGTGNAGYDKANASAIALTFGHQLSKLTLNIPAPATSTGITAADLTSMTVRIAGLNTQASFNLATGALGTASTKANITPLTVTAGAKYEAILLPDNFSGVTVTFGITAGSNPGNYVWNVPAGAFEAGKEYVYSISFTGAGGNVSVTGTINPWDVVTPEISLTEPADGADLLIYDEAPAYRFQWTPLDGITNYTVKIATTQAGLATTPLTFEVTSDNYRDVTIDECKAILAAAGITNNGNTHTLYWTVVPTYWTTTRYGIRSVKVSYPNILPKNLWPWIGASDCYEYDCSNPENRPENAIDGDLNTSWRCAWVNASEHRLSIDLGKVCTISKIIIHSSNEFLPPKRMRFIREEVMGTQISLGDQFMFSQSSPEVGSVHVLDQPVSARYLTIDVVESTYDNSNNANIQVMIAEIDLE